jgi:hypothetical protein
VISDLCTTLLQVSDRIGGREVAGQDQMR